MKSDSSIFDSIRIKPEKTTRKVARSERACEHPGCERPGEHRAPKGRGREGEYFHFCIDHVREYNKTYNYFNGMGDDDVASYQKDALTGHRPTWKMGDRHATAEHRARTASRNAGYSGRMRDPYRVFGRDGNAGPDRSRERKVMPLEQKAYDTLDLDPSATKSDVKARYKALVKKHHPDANGGDRSSEERLRQIIQAYNTLKNAGQA